LIGLPLKLGLVLRRSLLLLVLPGLSAPLHGVTNQTDVGANVPGTLWRGFGDNGKCCGELLGCQALKFWIAIVAKPTRAVSAAWRAAAL
jgi:hypothetical protein